MEPVINAILVGHGSAHAAASTGVVVGAVESAVEVDGFLDEGVDLFDAGHVAGDEGGFAAGLTYQGDGLRTADFVDVGDNDFSTFTSEGSGGGAARPSPAPVTRATLSCITPTMRVLPASLFEDVQPVE